MSYTIEPNYTRYDCNWCPQVGMPGSYAITVDGWTDYACREHARRYFPEFTVEGVGTVDSYVHAVTPAASCVDAPWGVITRITEDVESLTVWVRWEGAEHPDPMGIGDLAPHGDHGVIAVPFPVTTGTHTWGVVCPVHRHPDDAPRHYDRADAEAMAEALVCVL